MPVIVTGGTLTAARLFVKCRQALNLSPEGMQDFLCIMDLSTIEKIERGVIDVHGPTWVCLWYILQSRIIEMPNNVNSLAELQIQVEEYMLAIRHEALQRRVRILENRAQRRIEQQ